MILIDSVSQKPSMVAKSSSLLPELNKKSSHIRYLFDSGSQRTYITECLRDKLNLKPIGQEQLHLGIEL